MTLTKLHAAPRSTGSSAEGLQCTLSLSGFAHFSFQNDSPRYLLLWFCDLKVAARRRIHLLGTIAIF